VNNFKLFLFLKLIFFINWVGPKARVPQRAELGQLYLCSFIIRAFFRPIRKSPSPTWASPSRTGYPVLTPLISNSGNGLLFLTCGRFVQSHHFLSFFFKIFLFITTIWFGRNGFLIFFRFSSFLAL